MLRVLEVREYSLDIFVAHCLDEMLILAVHLPHEHQNLEGNKRKQVEFMVLVRTGRADMNMVQISDVESSGLSLQLDIGLGTCGRLVPLCAAYRTT
jgi:hypothetical protein